MMYMLVYFLGVPPEYRRKRRTQESRHSGVHVRSRPASFASNLPTAWLLPRGRTLTTAHTKRSYIRDLAVQCQNCLFCV